MDRGKNVQKNRRPLVAVQYAYGAIGGPVIVVSNLGG